MKVEEISRVKSEQADYWRMEQSQRAEPVELRYSQERIAHWDEVALRMDNWTGWGGAYQRRLAEIYRFLCPVEARVLEIGCGLGDLLAALKPASGLGVDFSGEMIERARVRHGELRFLRVDAHELELDEEFDVIILSDLVNDLWDVQEVFRRVARLSKPSTRVILNLYSRLWQPPLALAQKLGLAKPLLPQNWLTFEDVTGLLSLVDFEVIGHRAEVILPLPVPLVARFANRYLAKIWPFSFVAMSHVLVARPMPRP